MDLDVDEHALKHGLTESEIRAAWNNAIRKQNRSAPDENYIAAIGFTADGTAVQMVGVQKPFGVLIIHAMAPPTENVMRELNMMR